MTIIGSKAQAKELLQPVLELYSRSETFFVEELNKKILSEKIRFPVLEYVAEQIWLTVPSTKQLQLTDKIAGLKKVGGNVLIGKILQLRLEQYFERSLEKAVDYIIVGDEWYVCDIIGERVMGLALLQDPGKTIPVLKKYTRHENKWIVRCVGVATHYAVKKGLSEKHAEIMFGILLSCSGTTDFHTKKGIGWAVKTVAKFYPEIIAKNKKNMEVPEVKQWFKTKVKIGLGRANKYARRNNS
jgi:3-methyladenine DNA glycosylase AlkD